MNSVNIINNIFNEGVLDKLLTPQELADIQANPDKAPTIIAGNISNRADTVDQLKNLLGKEKINTSSIIRRARNSIFQFPVYISNNIPITHARVIANLFEHLYVTYVQAVLSQNKVIDIKDTPDLKFLKKFHTNIQESVGKILQNPYYVPIDEIDAMLEECKYSKVEFENGNSIEFSIYPAEDKDLIYECKEMMHEPLEGFSYLQEANSGQSGNQNQNQNQQANQNQTANANQTNQGAQQQNQQNQSNGPKKSKDTVANTLPPTMIKDLNDIRKINDMQPTMMIAKFKVKTENGGLEDIIYIVGVKAVLHIISASDLADEVREIVMGNQKALQKIRYKTGEISFLDYMFNVNTLKSDALNTTKVNKRWITTLKRLAEYHKTHGSYWKRGVELLNKGEVPIPNGTLVLTNVDVEYIADATGIDLDSISYAKRLATNLYLIAVAILNGESSFKYFLPDQQSKWDVLSLSSINTTLARLDNTSLQKELGKIINNAGSVNR